MGRCSALGPSQPQMAEHLRGLGYLEWPTARRARLEEAHRRRGRRRREVHRVDVLDARPERCVEFVIRRGELAEKPRRAGPVEYDGGLTSIQRDELVLDAALQGNAILLTGDGNLTAAAQSRRVFTLST